LKYKKLLLLSSGHGRGSNIRAIHERLQKESWAIEIVGVGVTRKAIPVAAYCTQHSIPMWQYPCTDMKQYEEELLQFCEDNEPDLIALAGFMKQLSPQFLDRVKCPIINIHPALLPKYGGKGMYGMAVHEAVWKAKEFISGATVHFVNKEYDKGEILLQKSVSISECLSPEDIAGKVLKIEHEIYAEAIYKALFV